MLEEDDKSKTLQQEARETCENWVQEIGLDSRTNLRDFWESMSLLSETFWYLMFTAIRDRNTKPVDKSKVLRLISDGQEKYMTMEDIEEKFASDNPDILTSYTCVPDQAFPHRADVYLNTQTLARSLKKTYDSNLQKRKETLAADNPKWTREEVEKQASSITLKKIRLSRENQFRRFRISMMAEEKVQKSIKAAMEEFRIPVHVLRGVATFTEIGRFLEDLGIEMSALKAFWSSDDYGMGTWECEHDIVIIALPPTGPLVAFVQVRDFTITSHWSRNNVLR